MPTRLTTTPIVPAKADVVAPSRPGVIVTPIRPPTVKLPDINPDIRLGKAGATAAGLIINRTFDGLTPQAASDKIRGAFQGSIAPQNENLVRTTADARVRDMQVALNNCYTPNTPNRKFLDSQAPATIAVLGSMSSSNPVVYEVTKQGQPTKYYAKNWSGGFAEVQKPIQVVMRGQINLDPPQLKMDYPAWSNKGLGGQISTVTEG